MDEREGTVCTDSTAWGLVIGGILGAVVGAMTDSLSLALWIAIGIGITFATGYKMMSISQYTVFNLCIQYDD